MAATAPPPPSDASEEEEGTAALSLEAATPPLRSSSVASSASNTTVRHQPLPIAVWILWGETCVDSLAVLCRQAALEKILAADTILGGSPSVFELTPMEKVSPPEPEPEPGTEPVHVAPRNDA